MTFIKKENASASQAPITALRQHDWFSSLNECELAELSKKSHLLRFEAGKTLFSQNQACTECLLILSGKVQGLRYTENGKEKIFGVIRAGSFVALASVFVKPYLHWHSIRAKSSGSGFIISAKSLRQVCLLNAQLANHIILQTAKLLQHHTEQIDWLTSSTAEQRLADYILRFGRRKENDAIFLPLSWEQIATKLGMRAETLSRLLAKWRHYGYINHRRSEIHTINKEALLEIAKTHSA